MSDKITQEIQNDPLFRDLEYSLIRSLVISMFGEFISISPDPIKVTESVLSNWESSIAEHIQNRLMEIDKELKAKGLSPQTQKVFEALLGKKIIDPAELSEKSALYIELIKKAYLKPIYDYYSNK